jgi:UrcA family protein
MSRSHSPLLATLFLSTTIAQSALAGAPTSTELRLGHVPVRYHDLDLRKEADAQVLLGRLESAAVTACGGNPRFHPSYELMPKRTVEVFQECRRNAVATAVTKVGAPALSQAFTAAYGMYAADRTV